MLLETEHKEYLTAMLGFSKKIYTNDPTITEEIEKLNASELGEDKRSKFQDIVIGAIGEQQTEENIVFIKGILPEINFIRDKQYVDALLSIAILPGELDELKALVSGSLDKTLEIQNSENMYHFYNRLSFLAIATKDPELIQKAIDKVQSL